MSYKLDLDTRFDDRRAYTPRHLKTEPPLEPVELPAWANEHARPIPALVGERPTERIPYPSHSEGATHEALRAPEPAPKVTLLARCLHSLRERVRL